MTWIRTSLSVFWAIRRLSLNTRYRAAQVMSVPWPMSPNMTANRKGKVMMVYGAGGETRGRGGREGGKQASHEGRAGVRQVEQHDRNMSRHTTCPNKVIMSDVVDWSAQ